eukprot:scaffold7202_cov403-Prasinococcus_capsulatus_cf.AAC.11
MSALWAPARPSRAGTAHTRADRHYSGRCPSPLHCSGWRPTAAWRVRLITVHVDPRLPRPDCARGRGRCSYL